MGYHRIERKILDMGNAVGETGCWQTRIAGIERPKVLEEALIPIHSETIIQAPRNPPSMRGPALGQHFPHYG